MISKAASLTLGLFCLLCLSAYGQPASEGGARSMPELADFSYGSDPRQVLDVYLAESEKPTPAVLHIHGGGWVRGDKSNVPDLEQYLEAGISVVSINYRFTWQAQKAGIQPPVAWPLADAARALQTIRLNANAWRINPELIGATGSSAGACSSLYLAFHDDMASAESPDPVERESTRLMCAAVFGAQTTLDPAQMRQWIPNSVYGGHAFGFMDPEDLASRDKKFDQFLESRSSIQHWIERYSPWALVTSDDPPIHLQYGRATSEDPMAPDPTHSAQFGVHLQDRCRQAGVPCELAYPGSTGNRYQDSAAFLIAQLRQP